MQTRNYVNEYEEIKSDKFINKLSQECIEIYDHLKKQITYISMKELSLLSGLTQRAVRKVINELVISGVKIINLNGYKLITNEKELKIATVKALKQGLTGIERAIALSPNLKSNTDFYFVIKRIKERYVIENPLHDKTLFEIKGDEHIG